MILGREAGNIFIYSSPPSLPPLARGELLLCTSKGEPGPPESPAEQALEELGKPGSPLASPASAPDSAALVVSCQDTEASPLPNQSTLAALSVLSFFSHLHGAPQPHSPVPLSLWENTASVGGAGGSGAALWLLPALGAHQQPWVPTTSPCPALGERWGSCSSCGCDWRTLAQEPRNSDAWAGGQGLGRCQADSQTPGRLCRAGWWWGGTVELSSRLLPQGCSQLELGAVGGG